MQLRGGEALFTRTQGQTHRTERLEQIEVIPCVWEVAFYYGFGMRKGLLGHKVSEALRNYMSCI